MRANDQRTVTEKDWMKKGSLMDKKQAHLQMVQGIVNRLSQNSFLLKGWSVLLVSSLFALAAFNSNPLFVYLTYLPVIAFWGLDGYFLWQERLFRVLYDRVRKLETGKIDFSMDTSLVKSQVASVLAVMFSKTLLAFHGTLFGTFMVIMVILLLTARRGA